MVESFKTNDMGLATYLKMCGQRLTRTVWIDRTCYWYFPMTDGLEERVGQWTEERATVNPKQFTREYAQTKKEFYESRNQT